MDIEWGSLLRVKDILLIRRRAFCDKNLYNF